MWIFSTPATQWQATAEQLIPKDWDSPIVKHLLARVLRTLAPMKPNTLAAFYDALAPGPESGAGVLPPPDMGQGVGHFNVFSLADLRGTF